MMRRSIEKPRWSSGSALLVLLALFFCLESSRAFALSIEDERIAGEKFVQDIRNHFEIVEDVYLNDFINRLGQYLTSSLETKPFPFQFYILKDSTSNAFAGPGGHVFVFTGLIEILDSIDELAGVICHEIGHVSGRHLAQRIEQNKMLSLATMASVLAAVLIGGEAAGPVITGSVAAGMQAQLHYSRNDERHADQLGFKYIEASGFHPSGIFTLLKKLQQGQWVGGTEIPPYLRTHPTGPERMALVEGMSKETHKGPEKPEVTEFRTQYPIFKTILRGWYLNPDDAERFFKKELEKEPDSGLGHLGMGIVWMRRSEYERASEYLKTAFKAMPGSIPVLRHLGEVYQLQGQDKEAIEILEKALDLDGRDKSVMYLLAGSYQNMGNYPRAIHIYEKLKTVKPVREDVYYNLGVAYGRQNLLALAHYNFGLYFKQLGNGQKARFHFDKAQEFARNNESLTGRIKEAMKDLH